MDRMKDFEGYTVWMNGGYPQTKICGKRVIEDVKGYD
jgi:hypothetical protein